MIFYNPDVLRENYMMYVGEIDDDFDETPKGKGTLFVELDGNHWGKV